MRVVSHESRRRGNVAVVVAVSLVMLLSFVALAIDGGLCLDKRRQVQSASDAAAMAAAGDLYYNYPVELGADPNFTAKNAALATARANGFDHGVNCNVTVNIPPKSGPFTNVRGYAEVYIDVEQPRFFSRIFGSDATVPVGCRAVARGRKVSTKNAIICLDPDDKAALKIGGGGSSSVSGASIQVNSVDSEAVMVNGTGVTTVSELSITGTGPGYVTPGGGSVSGPVLTGTEPIPDPLAYLPPPDPNSMPVRSDRKIQHSAATTLFLFPGVYRGGISISGQGNIFLHPGIYYMDGGGFNWGGQGGLEGYEVMIYNKPYSVSDCISLAGTGKCILTPMKTGPYQGILFWQERGADVPVNIVGQGNLNITGTFYATGADMTVSGNGASDLIGSQYIVDTLTTMGNGNFSVNWTAHDTPGVREVALVE